MHLVSRPKKTYVLITVDSESSYRLESGFRSYCVNGVMPHDLDQWRERGIVSEGRAGWKIHADRLDTLREFREFEIRREAPDAEAKALLEQGRGGLPSIFRSMRKFGAPCVVFLDIAGLYVFGLRDFCRNAKPTPKATPVQINADGSVGLDWTRVMTRALVLLLFVASVLKLSAQSYSPFLYFQF